ncbi:hypothetical protein [Tychonema sp. LEGE 07203]|nr:hypothetical protein [Tychonema sp. LEGE 07203]MBE9093465.1 hypothetical protein [Tychonema sp. LEGE 07203]
MPIKQNPNLLQHKINFSSLVCRMKTTDALQAIGGRSPVPPLHKILSW